jgi:hypothetical protein
VLALALAVAIAPAAEAKLPNVTTKRAKRYLRAGVIRNYQPLWGSLYILGCERRVSSRVTVYCDLLWVDRYDGTPYTARGRVRAYFGGLYRWRIYNVAATEPGSEY